MGDETGRRPEIDAVPGIGRRVPAAFVEQGRGAVRVEDGDRWDFPGKGAAILADTVFQKPDDALEPWMIRKDGLPRGGQVADGPVVQNGDAVAVERDDAVVGQGAEQEVQKPAEDRQQLQSLA
jgi:hypothetical protein